MINNLKTWLSKPYPFPATTKSKLLISLGFGNFIFLFLFLFTPFGLSNLEDKKFLFSLGYGMITTIILSISFFIIPLIFSKLYRVWSVFKMICFTLGVLLMISMANTLFASEYNIVMKENKQLFLFFISKTFLVAIFPILAYIYFTERIANKKYRDFADSISENKIQQQTADTKNITLFGKNKNEYIEILQKDFLYISSERNYASVFLLQNGHIKETLLRNSLNQLEVQLKEYKFMVRCHKSYIVNTNQVTKLKGNARGYFLEIPNKEFLIPVSRTFPKELLFTLTKQRSS